MWLRLTLALECRGVPHFHITPSLLARFGALVALSEAQPGSTPCPAILWLCGLGQMTQCLSAYAPHRSALLLLLLPALLGG